MAETAPPWQENQPYEVRVTAKPLRSLTYDVLPPAPSSDTTAVIQEEGTNVVVKRASNGAEREFRGRSAKTTPLDAALIFDAKAGTFELRRVAAAAVKLAPPPPASLAPSPKKKPGARKRAPTQRFSAMTDGGKTYRPAPPAPADEEAELVCQPRKKARPATAPTAAKPKAKKKASATGEDAKSLVARAAPIAVVQKNPKRGASGERFKKYMAATTAKEFLELGGTRADLKYDIARGWVTVLDRAPPPAQVPARGKKGQARPRAGSDDAVCRGYPG